MSVGTFFWLASHHSSNAAINFGILGSLTAAAREFISNNHSARNSLQKCLPAPARPHQREHAASLKKTLGRRDLSTTACGNFSSTSALIPTPIVSDERLHSTQHMENFCQRLPRVCLQISKSLFLVFAAFAIKSNYCVKWLRFITVEIIAKPSSP